MKMFLSVLTTGLLIFQVGHASQVENIDENIEKMGFNRFYHELVMDRNREQVKIAIFDFGFDGYEDERGYTISKNTELKVRPGDTNFRSPDDKNTHGLAMAQIMTQYMTKNYSRWSFAPKIYLYKSDGYKNFQWAIDDAVKNGIDIVLHSIVIEYGSNYDGRGFYNDLVNRATQAGIIWINAAGNFGLTTYNSYATAGDNGWLTIEDTDNDALPVKCELPKEAQKTQNKKCNVRLVLTWNDFKDKPLIGTNKDLDLYLFDKNSKLLSLSTLNQIENPKSAKGKPGYSLYPREIIETQIPEGTAYIKVKFKSDNFTGDEKLRLTADGEDISFPIRDEEERLLNPADNPNVITVGEDSDHSSVSKSLGKPELVAPSLVDGDDGRKYMGSSNAAAVVAAGIGLMKKLNPSLDRNSILDLAHNNASTEEIMNHPTSYNYVGQPIASNFVSPPELNSGFVQSDRQVSNYNNNNNNNNVDSLVRPPVIQQSNGQVRDREFHNVNHGNGNTNTYNNNIYAIPTKVLQFGPADNLGCFPLGDIKAVEPCTIGNFIIKSHGLLVATTSGLKIGVTFDPMELLSHDVRLDIRDIIAILPFEEYPFHRLARNLPMPPGAIEIFKLPIDEAICKLPDWDFLMTELEVSRRRVFEANSVGAFNNYIPPTCSADSLLNIQFPMSNWNMYPILQHTPYMAPIGPAPVGGGYGYNNRRQESHNNQQQSSEDSSQNFRLPDPNEVRGH
jgi:hypothetical protein